MNRRDNVIHDAMKKIAEARSKGQRSIKIETTSTLARTIYAHIDSIDRYRVTVSTVNPEVTNVYIFWD